jgi:hypothetical protein
MKAISYVEHEKWDKLSKEKQKIIINELWGFLYGHDEDVQINFTPLHLIALFEYDEEKLKEISELILTELWQNLEDVGEAIETLKKTNLKELCDDIRTKLEDVPDTRD